MIENIGTKLLAVALGIMVVTGAWFVFYLEDDEEKTSLYAPTEYLPEDSLDGDRWIPGYIVLVDEPTTEEELTSIATLSSIVVHGGDNNTLYHPMFILEAGMLDEHELWTIEHLSSLSGASILLFSNNDATLSTVSEQLPDFNIAHFPLDGKIASMFYGFEDVITVASYKEALWGAPVANIDNKVLMLGEQTFNTQEDAWSELFGRGILANYVILTNPEDYKGDDVFYSVITDNDGEEFNESFHIPSLSAVAAEMAAYHHAYVLTDIDSNGTFGEEFADISATRDEGINNWPINALLQLRNLSENYGPIEYIALVGSAEAVPHFDLPDYSGSEPDYTSSDVIYGFLDDDPYTMDAAVGRIVNYNVQGASNMIVRTFGYHLLDETVTVQSDEGTRTKEWRKHGSSWNGYEVADIRLQNTPGVFFREDMEDESYTCDYISTLGAGSTDDNEFATNFRAVLESSGMVAYRGHGSWHGSFYTWGYFLNSGAAVAGMGDDDRGHLEGKYAREIFMPPQTAMIVSCENTKIHGLSYGGDPIDRERIFATSYLYGGAIDLVGANEVSYSNVGQDGFVVSSFVTGSSEWDLNDLWYAAFWDHILDGTGEFSGDANNPHHEGPEVDNGKAVQFAENRYMAEHEGISPMIKPDSDGAHWKETAMFCLLGEPKFKVWQDSPGTKDFDPWH